MFKKFLSATLIVLLLNMVGIASSFAKSKEEKEAQRVEKIKNGIAKLGTGEAARIEVKLRDKTKLKGYIKEAGNETFTVVDAKTGAETTVAYPTTKQVKGNNLSTGAKFAIGIGIGVGITLLILIIIARSDD